MKTFQEQYDKMLKAYINDEIHGGSCEKCFVGNLLNKNEDWAYVRKIIICNPFKSVLAPSSTFFHIGKKLIEIESDNTYTPEEIVALENCFMNKHIHQRGDDDYEYLIFKAFEATLLLLRQIHESKGEVIKDYTFTKRELARV